MYVYTCARVQFGEKLGKGQLYGATRLFRGYKEPASREDRVPPIGHLVFTVHGIGQNMGSSDINKSTTEYVCTLYVHVRTCMYSTVEPLYCGICPD